MKSTSFPLVRLITPALHLILQNEHNTPPRPQPLQPPLAPAQTPTPAPAQTPTPAAPAPPVAPVLDEAQRAALIAEMLGAFEFQEEHFADDEVSELDHTTVVPAHTAAGCGAGLHMPAAGDEASVRTTPLP